MNYTRTGEAYELVHDVLCQDQRLIEVVYVREKPGEVEGAKIEHETFEGKRRLGF